MRVKFLLMLTLTCLAPAGHAALYVWGGAGSETTTVAWNDTADNGDGVNGDPDHWGSDVPPNPFGIDSVIIDSGGVSRNPLRITGDSFVEVLSGGYLFVGSNGLDVGRNADDSAGVGGRLTVDGGYVNAQWFGVYPNSTGQIISGRVNLRGGSDPLPGRGGYINFIGNSGILTAPNKTADPLFIQGNVLDGSIRIEGVRLGAIDQVVNGKHFELTNGGTTLTLVSPKALEPSPRMFSHDVAVDAVLRWSTGRDPSNPAGPNPAITRHFVWLSTGNPADPNMACVATIGAAETAEYAPPEGFHRDGVYYWRVDEGIGDYPAGDPNNIVGDVWQFTTVPSTPVIDDTTPGNLLVDRHEDAAMSVLAINPHTGDSTGLNYTWFKVGPPDVAVGTNSPTLTFTDADLNDEGTYYCRVTVASSGGFSISQTATMTIKRLIGHWPFDTNLDDVTGGNSGSAPSVQYVRGVVGDAVIFIATSAAVEIPTTAHKNLSWSLTWWEKSNPDAGGGEWEAMIASGATTGFEALEADRYRTDGYAIGVAGTYVYSNTATPFPRGQWHHLAAAYDEAAAALTLYVDGVVAQTATASNFDGFDVALFAGNTRDGTQPYLGVLDDLRFYNYPLTAREVASLYTDVRPDVVLCLGAPARDLDGDCDVDIYDLAILAGAWTDCNLLPDCVN